MSQADHAPVAPSAAHKIVMCPGSRRMEAMFPQEPTIETMEGDAAHWAAAEGLRYSPVAVGQVTPNGVTLNAEMIEAAELYSGHIITRELGDIGHVERQLQAAQVMPENYGTPDHIKFRFDERHLFVDDFKYGHGFVDAMWNWQLANYAYLALAGADVVRDGDYKVTGTVIQPRNYNRDGPVRVWETTVRELWPMFSHMHERFRMSLRDDAPCFATDPDVCKNCSARGSCEAAQMAGFNAVPLAYASTPLVMSPAAVGLELRILRRAAKQMQARISGLEEHLVANPSGSGFVIQQTPGRQVWRDDSAVLDVLAVGAAMGIDVSKRDAVTPKQAIKAGLPESIVAERSKVTNGKAELVPATQSEASKIFGIKPQQNLEQQT